LVKGLCGRTISAAVRTDLDRQGRQRVKLMKVAGAYWRGDSETRMPPASTAPAFAKQRKLDAYLNRIEEAEKRRHAASAADGSVPFQEEGAWLVFWHPKGWTALFKRWKTTSAAGRRRSSASPR